VAGWSPRGHAKRGRAVRLGQLRGSAPAPALCQPTPCGECRGRIGGNCSADRTAVVWPVTDVDRRRRPVSDRFGGERLRARSQPMAAVLSNRSFVGAGLWPFGCPEVAGSVSTPERQEADINRQRRLIGDFKVCAQSRLRRGLGRPGGVLLVTDRTAALGIKFQSAPRFPRRRPPRCQGSAR